MSDTVVPAYATEWYPHAMYMKDGFRDKNFYKHHTEHFGRPEEFGYEDFIPQFTGEKFDADALVVTMPKKRPGKHAYSLKIVGK